MNSFFVYKKTEQERRVRILLDKHRALILSTTTTVEAGGQSPNLLFSDSAADPVAEAALLTSMIEAKDHIHRILRFGDMNVQGFRKILKKLVSFSSQLSNCKVRQATGTLGSGSLHAHKGWRNAIRRSSIIRSSIGCSG